MFHSLVLNSLFPVFDCDENSKLQPMSLCSPNLKGKISVANFLMQVRGLNVNFLK